MATPPGHGPGDARARRSRKWATVLVDTTDGGTMSATDGAATEVLGGAAVTAENRSVDIDAATLVHRRFGNRESDAPPLLCLQHFRGNLDNWDPALVDRLAGDREVILLDNRGVGASTGVVPDNVEDMARDVLRFIDALGLDTGRSARLLARRLHRAGAGAGTPAARSAGSCSPAPRRGAPRGSTAGPTTSMRSPPRTWPTRAASSGCSSPAPTRAGPRAWTYLAADLRPDGRPRRADRPRHARRPTGGDHPLGDPGPVAARAPGGDHPAGRSSPTATTTR